MEYVLPDLMDGVTFELLVCHKSKLVKSKFYCLDFRSFDTWNEHSRWHRVKKLFNPCPLVILFFRLRLWSVPLWTPYPYWWIYSERGPDKKVQIGEKCQVCNEQATGFNYGALTCNPCKSFFRRTILENNLTQVKLSNKTLLHMLRNK